ncbi:zinc finger BED domain-containing protein 4-like [Rhizophagus clarus]|uniref:Zinc finger BED domain-containing protein 4-like n=1 Tax=Rhizophagus clarus TaxID=94130 RepID=A0A8H3LN54_9GLOM|nr:zinc finger BED domain-containing protein 4-like [Rhizophagus clarus]
MATTTRNKHRQLAKEAERQILVQEEESDTDSDYKATNSSKSEEEASDQTISDNDVINISNDNDDDDADISINENVSKKRKPPSKIIKPKTSWVWKFFRETEDGSKVICLIEGCEKMLKWYGSPSSMKTHLSGTHHITKGIAANYLEALQKGDQNLISNIIEEEKSKSHPYSKQESLTKNVIGFVIGTVQPLSIVEDKDFIKMVNGFDLFYKVPCTKTLKEQISLAYEAGTEKVKNQLLQLENISLTLDTWSSSAHIPYLGVTAHWVTSKFEPYELLLSMEELPYPHGAIEIQEHLIDLFDDWGISSKINGSNVKKACSNMNIGERIPCIVHTLQLSVGKGLDIAKVLINKCKCLIAFLANDKKK